MRIHATATNDPSLLAAEVRRLAAALDDATGEVTRLRAEVERLSRPATWQDECVAVEAAFQQSGVQPNWPDDEPGGIGPMAAAMAAEVARLRERLRNGAPDAREVAPQPSPEGGGTRRDGDTGGATTNTADAAVGDTAPVPKPVAAQSLTCDMARQPFDSASANHDAAPAAGRGAMSDTARQPVLWALDFGGEPLHPDFVFTSAEYAENYKRQTISHCQIVALYRDPPPPTLTDAEPLAWGVVPGGDLPLWRCRSREQAEAVRVWLEQQRPGSEPEVVPLVDGRVQPTLTDAQREALEWALRETKFFNTEDHPEVDSHAAAFRALLARLGGVR